MSDKPNGGSAFPNLVETLKTGDIIRFQHGMTLRDWFAGQAIVAAAVQGFDDTATVEQNARVAASWAYCIADAMLEARK